jgi:hypothetical protein
MQKLLAFLPALLFSWVSAQTTIFSQDFNGVWTTAAPPAGWRITYEGNPSIAAWHKEPDQGVNPWYANHTGYAAIYYDYNQPGIHTDSLISPAIDCSTWWSTSLRCSTYFRPDVSQPWTAKLMISSDNGANWSTLFDYTDLLGPGRQVFDVSAYADLNSQVKVMWVWQGDLVNLHWWALDNVSVTGLPASAHDLAAGTIRRPRPNELPNALFSPKADFVNVGMNPETDVPVCCEIRDHGGSLVYGDVQRVTLALRERRAVSFLPVPGGLPADTAYQVWFLVDTLDDNPANDTSRLKFNAQYQMLVAYDDGRVAGDSHWTTGNTGWGLMVVPETTPAQILDARFNLHVAHQGWTYYYKIRLVDDDGPGNSPGTTLYESGRLLAQEAWNITPLEDLRLYAFHDTCYLFYIQVNDWPDAAELRYDSARTESVQYWKLTEAGYRPDSSSADWMIRCSLDLAPAPMPAQVNARTVFVSQPEDELVRRPLGVGFAPEARVENFGGVPIAPLPCVCSVFTRTGGLAYSNLAWVSNLQPGQGTLVSFPAWAPDFSDSARVVVRTVASGDVDPSDDTTSKMVLIHQSHYTGHESLDGYSWIDSDTLGGPLFDWMDTTNAYILIASNIDLRVRIPVNPGQFRFPYQDTTYDQFWVCNNGWMSLGADPRSQTYLNLPLPDTSAPKPGLFPFWDNMYAGLTTHSRVYFKLVTADSTRRLVVIWHDMRLFSADTNNLLTFEAILEEQTGRIWFQYKHVNGGLSTNNYGRSATVGIQSRDGHRGLQYLDGDLDNAGDWPGNRLADGRVILFLPPGSGGVHEAAPVLRTQIRVGPNPCRDRTRIEYTLAAPGRVSLKLYDVVGKLVSTLFNGYHPAGSYSYSLLTTHYSLASGIYLLRFETEDCRITRKLTVN